MAHKLTVYIGRFQPFHKGHAYVLENALETSDAVLVLVGSAFQSRTVKNPFTFEERAEMIEGWAMEGIPKKLYGPSKGYTDHPAMKANPKLMIRALRDQPYNNAKWIQSVQETVDQVIYDHGWDRNETEVFITGSDRDESTWYLSAFPQYTQNLVKALSVKGDLSATNLRKRLFSEPRISNFGWDDVPEDIHNFLQLWAGGKEHRQLCDEYEYIEKYKQAWRAAPYAPTFVTVDNVVIQSGHVLVIERANQPGRGLWALPGGFVNPKETLKDAAVRELIEETGIKIQAHVLTNLIRAKEIFDDPGRSLRGRTLTTAFLMRLDDTKPLPKVSGQNAPLHETGGKEVVETSRAFWLPIAEARSKSHMWFEDHLHIMETMLGFIKD